MPLPDPHRSRVVLIGASTFTDPALAELPAVRNNLTDLAACLRDPDLWGLPETHCVVVPDPELPDDFLDPVHSAAEAAEDTLLVYYAGHGQLDYATNELLLAVGRSKSGRSHTSVRYEYVQRDVRHARARRRVVILDCCYSGKAMSDGMADPTTAVADEASATGTYLIASAPPNKQALSPPGEPHTAFTGELITLLRNGLPGGEPFLDLDAIYRHVFYALRDKSRPEPQKRAGNTAGDLALARNVRWRSPQAQADWEETKAARRQAGVTYNRSDSYRIEGEIGGTGTLPVRLATDVRTGQTVVVKRLNTEDLLVIRNLQTVASFDHPGIVRILHLERLGGLLRNIVMEYVEGQLLADEWIPIEPRRVASIVAQICDALDYGHQRGLVHGEINSRNVMITPDDTVKLLNFGTRLAPRGAERTDVYDAAKLLFELITGVPPFVPGIGAAIPDGLVPIINTAFHSEPSKRYQSAETLHDALILWLAWVRE